MESSFTKKSLSEAFVSSEEVRRRKGALKSISDGNISSPELLFSEKVGEIEYLRSHSKIQRISTLAKMGYQLIGRQSDVTRKIVGERYLQPRFSKRKKNSIRNRGILEQIHIQQNKVDKSRFHFQRRIKENKFPQHRAVILATQHRIKRSEPKSNVLKKLKKEQEVIEGTSKKIEFIKRRQNEIRLKDEEYEKEKKLQKLTNEQMLQEKRIQAENYWKTEANKLVALTSQLCEVKQDDGIINLVNVAPENHNLPGHQNDGSKNNCLSQTGKNQNKISQQIQNNSRISSKYPNIFEQKYHNCEQNLFSNHTQSSPKFEYYPTISISNKTLFLDSEIRRASKMDTKSEKILDQTYPKHTTNKTDHYQNQCSILSSIHTRLQLEIKQNKIDGQALVLSLKDPIRRDPLLHEKEAMHMIKTRGKQLMQSLRVLDTRQMTFQSEQQITVPEGLQSQKKDYYPQNKDTVNCLDDPPMIVGRNLAKIFDPFWSIPEMAYRKIVFASEVVIANSKADIIIKNQSNRRKDNIDLWKKKNDRLSAIAQIDLLHTRAARSEEIISVLRKNQEYTDINDSILQFYKERCHLETVTTNLENKIKADNTTSNKVLSEFVKHTRIEERIGSRRVTGLLSEYMRATVSSSKIIDSGILFGVISKYHHSVRRCSPVFGTETSIDSRIVKSSEVGMMCSQRYKRHIFTDIIKHELKAHKNYQKKSISEKCYHEMRVENTRLETSKKGYLKRKRERYATLFAEADTIRNTCLVMIDAPFQGNLIVKDFKVKWNENGIHPQIFHYVQKANQHWNSISRDISVVIVRKNYFTFPSKEKRHDLGKIPRLNSLVKSCQSQIYFIPSHIEKERWEMTNEEGRLHFGIYSQNMNQFNKRHEIFQSQTDSSHGTFQNFLLNLRNHDAERKTSHVGALEFIGRINGFKESLKTANETYIDKKRGLTEALVSHDKFLQQKMLLEQKIDLIEAELIDVTSKLDIAPIARKKHRKITQKIKLESQKHDRLEMKISYLEKNLHSTKREASQIKISNETDLQRQIKKRSEMPQLRERAFILRQWANEHSEALESASKSLIMMHLKRKRQYVLTRFGPRKKLILRSAEMIFSVELYNYHSSIENKTRQVIMHIPFSECLDREKSLREESRVRMEQEEILSRKFREFQKSYQYTECTAMRRDEKILRNFYETELAMVNDEKFHTHYKNIAMRLAMNNIRTKLNRKKINQNAQKVILKRKETTLGASDLDNSPFIIRYWKEFNLRRKIYRNEKRKMLQEEALHIFNTGGYRKRQEEEREKRVHKSLAKEIVREVILETLVNIVKEEKRVDENMLREVQKKENITLTQLDCLDLKSYLYLLKVWQEKKKKLRRQLVGTKYSKPAILQPRSLDDIKAEIEKRKKHKNEEKRIRIEFVSMLSEDLSKKEIYHQELAIRLVERRMMETEDLEMKIFIDRVIKFQELENDCKNNVYKSQSKYIPTSKEFRRSQLKQGAARRQREQRENVYMETEDNLAGAYRENERRKKHLEILNCDRGSSSGQAYFGSPIIADTNPQNILSQQDFVKMEEDDDNDDCEEASFEKLSLELDWMEREEDARLCEEQLHQFEHETKIMDLALISQCKKELQTLNHANKLRQSIKAYQKINEDTSKNLARYSSQNQEVQKNLITAEFNEKWMDSSIITKVPQRWPTKALRKELHRQYFKHLGKLLLFIVTHDPLHKEIEEKDQSIRCILSEITEKNKALRLLQKTIIRRELLSLRRSKLGEKMFRITQRNILAKAFKCWSRFVSLLCTLKNVYKMKEFSVYMQSALSPHFETKKIRKTTKNSGGIPQTILEKVSSRMILCRRCKSTYDECRNHISACLFHPGKYSKDDPLSDGTKWSCCQQKLCSDSGCYSGYHLPPVEGHTLYSNRLRELEARDEKEKNMTLRLLETTQNSIHEGKKVKQKKLLEISKKLNRKRETANKFQSLKII